MSTEVKQQDLLSDLYEVSEEREVVIKSVPKPYLTTSTMVTIDCGNNYATIYLADKDKVEVISRDQLLSLPNLLAPGTTLVGEAAHVGTPQGESSLSQPFKEEM